MAVLIRHHTPIHGLKTTTLHYVGYSPLQSIIVRYNRKFIFSVSPLYFRCSSRVRSWTDTFFTLYFTYQSSYIQSLFLTSLLIIMLMTLSSIVLSLKTQAGLDRLANCSVHLKHWFPAHDLLNPTKSETSYFGT